MDRLKTSGLNLGNLMIGGFNNAIYGRPGRDEEIEKVIASIQRPVRPDYPSSNTTGTPTRHGGLLRRDDDVAPVSVDWLDYDLVRTPAANTWAASRRGSFHQVPRPASLANEAPHTLQEMWATITYFLKKVIPEAEKAGSGWRCIPTIPRPDQPRSQQIMAAWTLEAPHRNLRSPANGITSIAADREMARTPSKSAPTLHRATASTTFTSAT